MRYFICILALVGFSGCRSLSGTYTESFGVGWGGATYHFHKDGTFEYRSKYDVGGEYGHGSYRISCGRIKLSFTKARTEPYIAASYCFTLRDSTDSTRNVRLQFLDENRAPLVFGELICKLHGDTTVLTGHTDLEGVLFVRLPNKCDSIHISFNYLGFERFEKVISTIENDGLKVMLYPDPNRGMTPVDSGTIWRSWIRQNSSDEIQLSNAQIRKMEDKNSKARIKVIRKSKKLKKLE